MTTRRVNKPEVMAEAIACQGYDVLSWSSDPKPGNSPAEAVMFVLHVGDDARIALRIKTRKAVDVLIEALAHHRDDVWPVTDTPENEICETVDIGHDWHEGECARCGTEE